MLIENEKIILEKKHEKNKKNKCCELLLFYLKSFKVSSMDWVLSVVKFATNKLNQINCRF